MRARESTPLMFCLQCGTQIHRRVYKDGTIDSPSMMKKRKYCSLRCAGKAHSSKPPTSSSWGATHHRARKLVPPGSCAVCGRDNAKDVHHRDGDHSNNAIANLVRICRSCHIKEHRKLDRNFMLRSAKLTWEKAEAVRVAATTVSAYKELATMFGISRSTVGDILRNRTWRDNALIGLESA